jgi:hypothetical protein
LRVRASRPTCRNRSAADGRLVVRPLAVPPVRMKRPATFVARGSVVRTHRRKTQRTHHPSALQVAVCGRDGPSPVRSALLFLQMDPFGSQQLSCRNQAELIPSRFGKWNTSKTPCAGDRIPFRTKRNKEWTIGCDQLFLAPVLHVLDHFYPEFGRLFPFDSHKQPQLLRRVWVTQADRRSESKREVAERVWCNRVMEVKARPKAEHHMVNNGRIHEATPFVLTDYSTTVGILTTVDSIHGPGC